MRRSRCLGLRVYHRGARTHMHVNTHATWHARTLRTTRRACSESTTPVGNVYFCNYRVAYQNDSATISVNATIVNNVFCEYHRKYIHEILLNSLCSQNILNCYFERLNKRIGIHICIKYPVSLYV